MAYEKTGTHWIDALSEAERGFLETHARLSTDKTVFYMDAPVYNRLRRDAGENFDLNARVKLPGGKRAHYVVAQPGGDVWMPCNGRTVPLGQWETASVKLRVCGASMCRREHAEKERWRTGKLDSRLDRRIVGRVEWLWMKRLVPGAQQDSP